MTPKEKAQELIDKFKDYVHGYIGGSMLSNYEYPEQILAQAKKCALIVVDVILIDCGAKDWLGDVEANGKNYWEEVKKEIINN